MGRKQSRSPEQTPLCVGWDYLSGGATLSARLKWCRYEADKLRILWSKFKVLCKTSTSHNGSVFILKTRWRQREIEAGRTVPTVQPLQPEDAADARDRPDAPLFGPQEGPDAQRLGSQVEMGAHDAQRLGPQVEMSDSQMLEENAGRYPYSSDEDEMLANSAPSAASPQALVSPAPGTPQFIGPPRPGSILAKHRDAIHNADAEAAEVPAEAAEVPAAPASAEEARIPDAMCESISSADDASPPARKQSRRHFGSPPQTSAQPVASIDLLTPVPRPPVMRLLSAQKALSVTAPKAPSSWSQVETQFEAGGGS